VSLVFWFLSLVGAVLVAALGELVSDEIRARLDLVPFALLAAAARRLPADQRADMYDQAWLPELHHILRGHEAVPITRLVHGSHYAIGLWFAAPAIGRALGEPTVEAVADHGPLDLLALRPAEVEHLVRQLFEAISFRPIMTQVSPGVSVDMVASYGDPGEARPVVVYLKHNDGTLVRWIALHHLAEGMANAGADRGFLVTTSLMGPSVQAYTRRHGTGMVIVDGPRLQTMLRQHLGLDTMLGPLQQPE
jgi:hypothetical protein